MDDRAEAMTLAVVGAGPGVGAHVAARFGREGFRVGLIARTQANLDALVSRLAAVGVEASGFLADATNEAALTEALDGVRSAFGTVDVVEYSPTPAAGSLATPRNITVENLRPHLGLAVGAVAAVQAVLPGMLASGNGGLLFTTAASAIEPVPFSSNFAMAQSGIRSYVHSLNGDLGQAGIYAGMVLIAGGVDKGDGTLQPRGTQEPTGASPMPIVGAWEVADTLWDLYTGRDRVEQVVGDMDAVKRLLAT